MASALKKSIARAIQPHGTSDLILDAPNNLIIINTKMKEPGF